MTEVAKELAREVMTSREIMKAATSDTITIKGDDYSRCIRLWFKHVKPKVEDDELKDEHIMDAPNSCFYDGWVEMPDKLKDLGKGQPNVQTDEFTHDIEGSYSPPPSPLSLSLSFSFLSLAALFLSSFFLACLCELSKDARKKGTVQFFAHT